MKRHPKRVSLCMIVKDEEDYLAACLDSVQGFADEVIIVDTGSKDRTVEIASVYGARVISKAWEQDFSKARNAGLERAEGEWILFLDADERLMEGAPEELQKYMGDPGISAMLLQIRNVVGNGESQGETVHPVLRMFRNNPQHRFEGRIHEQIAAAIVRNNPHARFHMTEAVIHHVGYKQEVVLSKKKEMRNIELLKMAIAEEPDNGFHRYNIGVEHLRLGEPEAALAAFRLSRQMPDFDQLNYAHLVIKYEALSLQLLSRWEEAASISEEGVQRYADYTDMWHYLALCSAYCGRLKKAQDAAERAIAIGTAPLGYHTEAGMGTYRTAYLLGKIFEALQDAQGAIRSYVEALRHQPDLLPPLFRMCVYMKASGQGAKLPQLLATRLQCTDAAAALKLSAVLALSGCEQESYAWTKLQASLQKEEQTKRELLHASELLRNGDWSGLPLLASSKEKDTVSAVWRKRADLFLAQSQQARRTEIEKKALTAVRLLLPGNDGW
ncbi:glycosyltransferase [Paenibacillus sp. NPDC058071]|uniref:tetratricopeptide repeat-containing glycosyltransferase family 2 protein n=1 Tax=Paenibacillus sp. NPDC058071 TaxID=3346326 RepID=UPI0036D9F92C